MPEIKLGGLLRSSRSGEIEQILSSDTGIPVNNQGRIKYILPIAEPE
jgi:hypothetical protein